MPWKLILTIALKLGLDKWAKKKAQELGAKIFADASKKLSNMTEVAAIAEQKLFERSENQGH